jgi:2-polyprenyl-6-methoxyphenol hydroxylase-like FAD-dependent oxidoreductase
MERKTQVLVVGAGPVGLLAALCLRQRGLEVTVIDEHEPGRAKSFAVPLHPRTIAMLSKLGLFEPFVWQGQAYKRIVLYAEHERRASLEVPTDGELAVGGLTLPQSVIRNALELALQAQGVHVDYLHRFATLAEDAKHVRAQVARREPVSSPHSSAGHFEWREVETLTLAADFVIGTDGHASSVRRALGVGWRSAGVPKLFGFFDVPHEPPVGQSLELVLGRDASAMYPMHGGATRYAFELGGLPSKPFDAEKLMELRRSRMPWHAAGRESVEWAGVHEFDRGVVERFGRGRTWLAGDAAHSTLPLGAQSLNVGLYEARELASGIAEAVETGDTLHLAAHYGRERELEWQRLLSLGGKPSTNQATPGWAKTHIVDLIAALPASGDDLDDCLEQLGVTLL